MLDEPFWLGLLAVCVVLCILGIGYYFKKHVPDKFDKFLGYGGGETNDQAAEKPSGGASRFGGFGQYNTQMSTGSDNVEGLSVINDHRPPNIGILGSTNSQNSNYEYSPNSSKRSFLGKLSIRKPSVLSTSSAASSPGYGDKKNFSSTEDMFNKRSPSTSPKFLTNKRDEEERRKILKMLVTPQNSTRRTLSSASFDTMVMKAARSAENLQQTSAVMSSVNSVAGESSRKISSSSLQIPAPGGLLRRSNSDNTGTSTQDHQDDTASGKKVTFSQVVDQMACSLSDSSSLSDLSSCAEDFKRNVSSSIGHTPNPHGSRSGRQGRKLFRSKRKQALLTGNGNSLQLSANYFQYQYKRRHPSNGTSGSEDRCGDESSMESIESTPHNLSLSPLSALSLPSDSSKSVSIKKLQKISSADSLFTMIKNLAANRLNTSTPSSPQMSEAGDYLSSSGMPTPLTTPDTPNAKPSNAFAPRAKEYFLRKPSSNTNSASTSPVSSPSPTRTPCCNQIMVEVLDPLNPRRSEKQSGSNSGSGQSQPNPTPTITLEVPSFHYGGKCLSPIKELPSPVPTPSPSPLPFRQSLMLCNGPQSRANSVEEDVSSSSSSGRSSSTASNGSNSRRNSLRQLFRHRDAVDEDGDDIQLAVSRGYNEIFIPVPNIRRDSVCRSSFASDFDPFEETSFILSRQNSDAFFDTSLLPFVSPIPAITLTSYETESCEEEASEKSGDERAEKDDLQVVAPIMIDITPPSPPPMIINPGEKRDIPQLFVSFDDEDGNETVEELCQPPQGSENQSSPSDSQASSPTSDSPISGKAKRRPPPLYILNSNFANHGSNDSGKQTFESPKTSSPTSRKCLVKQSVVCEDSMAQSGPNDSPKFLIPPGKFDSTPRSRSQSVELRQDFVDQQHAIVVMEAKRNYDMAQKQTQNMMSIQQGHSSTIVSVVTMGGRRPSTDGYFSKKDLFVKQSSVNLVVQPPTPLSSTEGLNYDMQFYPSSGKRRDSREETLASIMRQRCVGDQGSTAAAVASWSEVRLGSPPAKRNSFSFGLGHSQQPRNLSFDYYSNAPAITITQMCDTGESETDSPVTRMSANPGGMHYLSPYTVVTSSRTTSESNLSSSSSGYSSMASPGPSRSGSSNPLSCLSESEDNTSGTPTKSNALFFTRQHHLLGPGCSFRLEAGPVFMRRPGSLLKSPSVDSESSDPSQQQAHKTYLIGTDRRQLMAARYRTDSETTDDQCIPESTSEPHDSALDSMDDCPEDDVLKMADIPVPNDAKPQVPQICLLEVQSSTESDKTVLSTATVFEQLRAINSDCSLPNSPGLIGPLSGGYESDAFYESRFNRAMLSLPEIVVLPCTPLPSSVESSPMSSSSSSSSLSLVHQSSSEHPTAGTSSSFSSSSFKNRRSFTRGGRSAPASLHTNPSTSVEYEQILSSAGFAALPTSLSSSRSESPASDRFTIKHASLISLHLRNIESELDILGSSASLNTKDAQECTSDEKRKRRVKKESKCEKTNWKGSSSSINVASKDRSSRRRTRRRTSAEQTSPARSAPPSCTEGNSTTLSPLCLRDPNTSSSNESVYSNNSNFGRQNIRRQCVTEQSSTDDSDPGQRISPTVKASKVSSTTSSSTSKACSPAVSLTTLTSQPLSHTRPQRVRHRRKRHKVTPEKKSTKLSPTTKSSPNGKLLTSGSGVVHTSLESSDSLTAADIPTNNVSTDDNTLA